MKYIQDPLNPYPEEIMSKTRKIKHKIIVPSNKGTPLDVNVKLNKVKTLSSKVGTLRAQHEDLARKHRLLDHNVFKEIEPAQHNRMLKIEERLAKIDKALFGLKAQHYAFVFIVLAILWWLK